MTEIYTSHQQQPSIIELGPSGIAISATVKFIRYLIKKLRHLANPEHTQSNFNRQKYIQPPKTAANNKALNAIKTAVT